MTFYKNFLLIFILLDGTVALSQRSCGAVYDVKTLVSVPYVNISSPTSNNFVFTDDQGRYCLENISIEDTFYISALGYKRLIIDGKTILKSDSLFIVSEPIQLREVKITTKKNNTKSQTIGFFETKAFQRKNSFAPNSNMKVAVYIKNSTGTDNVIEKLYYRLIPHPSEIASYFRVRVRIYKNGIRNLPSDDLLTKNVVFDVSPEQTVITQDILKENISIPSGGLWLGIETVGYGDKSGNYHPTGTGEIGKVTFKNSKKIRTDEIYSISPYYRTSREEKGVSAKKLEIGKARWSNFEVLDDKLTFMFGAKVLVNK